MARRQQIEIFMPPNVLKAKMGDAAIASDMGAVRRAEQAMEDLKSEFTEWMNCDVEKLGQSRDVYAKKANGKSKSALYRAGHDVKGQALTFEFPFASRVASSLCKLLDAPGFPPLKLVDAHVNAIRVVVSRDIRDTTDTVSLTLAEELEVRVAEILNAA